jgi:16S rRNA (guanine1207-N2)-methyltransferase
MSRESWENEWEHYFAEKPKTKSKVKRIRAFLRGREFIFETDRSVFAKDYVDMGTKRLIEKVQLPEEGEVLDWGCGYGAIGIAIAATHPKLKVWMVDINERAVALAKRNAKLNRVKNVVVLKSDSFSALPTELRFDAIVTNPPIHAGKKVLVQLIRDAFKWLKVGGSFWFVAQTQHGAKTLQRITEEVFGNAECVDIHGGYRVIAAVKESEQSPTAPET